MKDSGNLGPSLMNRIIELQEAIKVLRDFPEEFQELHINFLETQIYELGLVAEPVLFKKLWREEEFGNDEFSNKWEVDQVAEKIARVLSERAKKYGPRITYPPLENETGGPSSQDLKPPPTDSD